MKADTPLISIVMPAFNAEKFIKKAIESILSQTFQNFELIIADDCSTDSTVQIVKSYSDERIKLIHTQHNTGSAKFPRELAIEHARAPYICWIDSDDEVDPHYLDLMLQRKKETNADIVCSQMLAERDGIIQYRLPRDGFDYEKIVSGRDAVMMTIGVWHINCNGWLCDKDSWIGISTFKNPSIVQMDADNFSTREILLKASKVAFSHSIYHYRLHSSSITQKISNKSFDPAITERLILEFFKENKCKADIISMMNKSLCQCMISLLRLHTIHRNHLTPNDRRNSYKLLKRQFKKISLNEIFSTDLSLKSKLILLMPFELSYILIRNLNKNAYFSK